MAKKKKKKPNKGNVFQSPVKYIKTKVRSLPLKECLINADWREGEMANILVAREQPSGKLIVGMYLVDLLCLGVKNTFYYYSMETFEYDDLVADISTNLKSEPCDYALAHNIVYGAVEFAEELGIRPHKDFSITQYILAEDDESVEFIDMEFGREGMPVLIVREGMNPAPYIANLKKSVGEGNYKVMFDDGDYLDDDDEDEVLEERPFRPLIATYAENLQEENLNQEEQKVPQIPHYQITYDRTPSTHDRSYPDQVEALHDASEQTYMMTMENPEEAVALCKAYIAQYPEYPAFYNHLSNAYRLLDDQEAADKISRELYEHFPDYHFAKVNYAHLLLDEERYDESLQIFEGKLLLTQLYPDQKVFHFSVVLSFNLFLCYYFVLTDQLDKAIGYYQQMLEIDENHAMTLNAEHLIGTEITIKELEDLTKEIEKVKELGDRKRKTGNRKK